MRTLLFIVLAALGVICLVRWVQSVRNDRTESEGRGLPSPLLSTIGFVTNFFDTLGIGSFAPTTSWYKLQKLVPDERIPGTMLVGHTIPVIVQAFIFIAIIEVDMVTLTTLIGASVLGAWLGAGVVARWPRRRIQIGMGMALLIAGVTFVMANLGFAPVGGESIGLTGIPLAVGSTSFFMLGALMTLGIGMYAPAMIVISLLGMNPAVAFPIMMGSSAFLMPVAAVRFLKENAYEHRPALGLALGGVPAVLIATYIVGSLPLTTMRWLVVVVVTYAALAMLRSAWVERLVPVPEAA
jgi:uncharacterized membrane protein YfcA